MEKHKPSHQLAELFDVSLFLPSLGFGIFLFIADNINAPTLLIQSGSELYYSLFASLAILAGLTWIASHKDWNTTWSLPVIAVSALCVSAYYLLSLDVFGAIQTNVVVISILETISTISRAILFFFWMVALLPLGSRKMTIAFAFSLCIFAFVCLVTVVLKDDAARIFLALLPCASAVCLQLFYMQREKHFTLIHPCKDEIFIQAQECFDRQDNRLLYIASVAIPLICGSSVLALVYQLWPTITADFNQPIFAQMGLLVGALVMAFFVFLLVVFFWTNANLMLMSTIVPLLLVFMLWISISEPSWIFIYFSLMLIVEKSLLAIAMYSSYMFNLEHNWTTPWCLAFISFQVGGLVGLSIVHYAPETITLATLVVIMTIYIASACLASLYFGVKITQANAGYAAGGFRNENRYRKAVNHLISTYFLTPREGEILLELGRGRNASYIAERLIISPQTAKTHQKNIYAKMNLHSQQDLIMLIDQTIEQDSASK